MSLRLSIENAMKTAMKQKQKERLVALRAIKSAILLAQSEKEAGTELSEAQELQILSKAAKQRRESLQIYIQEGRDDLAAQEKAELEVIEEFLPKMLSEDEVKPIIQEIIQQVDAKSVKDMGKVMGVATQKLMGKADNKMISDIVKQLLAS
ncbi:MAG: GatB/YqeY domain-containing protein [Bernardetiaceae bacterium]|nr:GatB/YqeY domain-containing protein [Bernardetiaceae bacterium]